MGKQKKTAPKAYQVRLSLHAQHNLDEITGYIAFINHQPQNAIKVADAILAKFDSIEQHPYAFKECEQLATKSKMYRRAVCFSWNIIYKIKDTEITILGIIHSSRKPSSIKQLRKKQQ